MNKLASLSMDSPLGRLTIVADGRAVVAVRLPDMEGSAPAGGMEGANPVLTQAVGELKQYFAGTLKTFTVPVSFDRGTEFQRAVWTALASIPYGETRTYSWVAREIGRPTSVRAVGRACGQNPVAIIVPCHRVIGVDGSLTGYAGGMDCKRTLLSHEQRHSSRARP